MKDRKKLRWSSKCIVSICELNVVSQKLILHSFISHSFVLHSLSIVQISEINSFALKWENYSVRIIFSEIPVL